MRGRDTRHESQTSGIGIGKGCALTWEVNARVKCRRENGTHIIFYHLGCLVICTLLILHLMRGEGLKGYALCQIADFGLLLVFGQWHIS